VWGDRFPSFPNKELYMKLLLQKDSPTVFFTAVYKYYYVYNKAAEGIFAAPCERNFLDEYVEIKADDALAEKVKNGLVKSGGVCFLEEILFALKSGDKNKFNVVLKYLELFFSHGEKVKDMFGEKTVRDFFDIKRKVEREIERLLGFIRLKETSNGIFYGFFSSDNDILECLAPEFAKRFNTLSFFLHDYKRKKAAYYDGQGKIQSVINGKNQVENQNYAPPIHIKNDGQGKIQSLINGEKQIKNRDLSAFDEQQSKNQNYAPLIHIKNDGQEKIQRFIKDNTECENKNTFPPFSEYAKSENQNNPKKIQIQYGTVGENLNIELSERETVFQTLFKEYHKTVAIKGRENLKLQRAFAPKKYREFMSEFDA
jgi:probable DNA metabolism protein